MINSYFISNTLNGNLPNVEKATLPKVGQMNIMVVDDDENHKEKKQIMNALNQ